MTPVHPLLHIGESVRTALTVDRGIVLIAMLAFVAVCAVVWRDELRALRHPLARRSVRRRLAAAVAAALVAIAVAPSVLPYDHLLAGGHSDDHAVVHASHCHDTTPGDCAEAPVGSGPGQFIAASPLLVTPLMLSVLVMLSIPLWRGISRRPDIRPPMALLAA